MSKLLTREGLLNASPASQLGLQVAKHATCRKQALPKLVAGAYVLQPRLKARHILPTALNQVGCRPGGVSLAIWARKRITTPRRMALEAQL